MTLSLEYQFELMKMVWPFQAGSVFISDAGQRIEISRTGEYAAETDCVAGAEIVIDDVVFRGNVVFGVPEAAPSMFESCILQVVPAGFTTHILKDDGSFLPQIVLEPGAVSRTAYGMMREGAREQGCAHYIRSMESHERVALFTRLLADRLRRKCNDIEKIYEQCEQNWNETMYVMLFRAMGDSKNKESFTELARKVRYGYISRERNSLSVVEALLLGASGLLDIYPDDSYIRELKSHFEYLSKKYIIIPMTPGKWTFSNTNPHNHPVIRIAQLSAFLATREFLFENMIKCRTVEDIHNFFRAEASEYWSTHYIPSQRSFYKPKRIGHFKANVLGINLTVPMMFSYGDFLGDELLKDTALEMLEKINCEDNSIVNGWRSGGVQMESAFDSQAIIQLNNEYCAKGLCGSCGVGRRVIREIYLKEHSL